jgi:hypothetical protein
MTRYVPSLWGGAAREDFGQQLFLSWSLRPSELVLRPLVAPVVE